MIFMTLLGTAIAILSAEIAVTALIGFMVCADWDDGGATAAWFICCLLNTTIIVRMILERFS